MLIQVVYHRLYVSLRSIEEIILQGTIHLNGTIPVKEAIHLQGKIRFQEITLLQSKEATHLQRQEEILLRTKAVKRPIVMDELLQDTAVEIIAGEAKLGVMRITINSY